MNGHHFWLADDQFERLEPYLPTDTRGKARVDDRRVISGIVHVLKLGCRWVDAPVIYGPRKTLYNRFVRWADKGEHLSRIGFGRWPSGAGADQFIGGKGTSLCHRRKRGERAQAIGRSPQVA